MFDSLGNRQLVDPLRYDTLSETLQVQLQAALQARTVLVQRDAQRTIELGLSRPLRAHAMADFKMGDGVIIFIRNQTIREEKWAPGFRIVGITSHRLIVEKAPGFFVILNTLRDLKMIR